MEIKNNDKWESIFKMEDNHKRIKNLSNKLLVLKTNNNYYRIIIRLVILKIHK